MRDLPRIPLPTEATAADLARLPSPVRRAALFSARLNRAGPLVEIGGKVKGILDGNVSMSDARKAIRESLDAAGYVPPEGMEGTLRDHRGKARLDLILTQNVRRARGYARRAADMETLEDWPAQELVRVFHREKGRDWPMRWEAAGGQFTNGRMAALKTDPIWAAISRFGDPFPPFDYGSGMGLRDIDREEAEALGLIGPGDTLTPEEPEYPDVQEANLPGIAQMPELRAAVEKAMGPDVTFDGSVLRFTSPPPVAGAAGSPKTLGLQSLGRSVVSRAPEQVEPQEALAMIKRGTAATVDPDGRKVRIDMDAYKHWAKQGKPQGEVNERLKDIRRALDAIREPQERWTHKVRKGTGVYVDRIHYLKTTRDENGEHVNTLVVTELDGRAVTWFSNMKPSYRERTRTGGLQ